MRLDEIARWLQDVAFGDLVDAGLGGAGFWVVRRTRMLVERFPRFAETVRLRTFCTGASALAAERRTTVTSAEGTALEAVSIWVNLDPETRMPARLPNAYWAAYGDAIAGRKARGRLHHPSPPEAARDRRWQFRSTDLDLAGHVNNAVYWEIVEEGLGAEPSGARDVEIEYRAAAPPGEAVVLDEGEWLWVTSTAGEVYASARVGSEG